MDVKGKLQLFATVYLLLQVLGTNATTPLPDISGELADFDITRLYGKNGIIWTVKRFYYNDEIWSKDGKFETGTVCITDTVYKVEEGKAFFNRSTGTSGSWRHESLEGKFTKRPQAYKTPTSYKYPNHRMYMDVSKAGDEKVFEHEIMAHYVPPYGCAVILVLNAKDDGFSYHCDLRAEEGKAEDINPVCEEAFLEHCRPGDKQHHKIYASTCRSNL